jgi:hypothetical protein
MAGYAWRARDSVANTEREEWVKREKKPQVYLMRVSTTPCFSASEKTDLSSVANIGSAVFLARSDVA